MHSARLNVTTLVDETGRLPSDPLQPVARVSHREVKYMRTSTRIVALLPLLLVGCAVTHAENSSALAQYYPAKPVRVIEPFGLGGGPDLLARTLAPKLSELWGQPVTVKNHPGAGATAAPAQVAK